MALKVAIGGVILWCLTLGALYVTKDTILVPTLIFVGSFLSPVVFAVWLYAREQFSGASPDGIKSALNVPVLLVAFVGAGVLALTVAVVLETFLLSDLRLLWVPGVAVIEESLKLATVWIIALQLKYYTRRDGMVLGAAVGFGFAALESSGYAFNVVLKQQDRAQDLYDIINTELTRGLLAPVGHGLWTALVGGALFAAAAGGVKLRLTWSVVGWFFVAFGLHCLWDWANTIAVILTHLTTGSPITIGELRSGQLSQQATNNTLLYGFYSWLVLALCAIIGLILANRMWVKGRAVVSGFPYGPDGLPAATPN